jgi:Lysozyme like domain
VATLRIRVIHEHALLAGWTGDEAIVATLVAIRISGGDPAYALRPEDDAKPSLRGLWGLSVRSDAGAEAWALYDPAKNAVAAYRRWRDRGGRWDGHPAWPIEDLAGWIERYRPECVALGATQGELVAS